MRELLCPVVERRTFIEPDNDTQALIDAMNTNARSGYKEIYEVTESCGSERVR